MRTVKHGLIGLFSIVFLLGGVTMVTPFASEAQAASPAGLIADHDAEMTTQHDMIQQDISDTQTAIAEVKALVEALEPGAAVPLCGAGTEGQAFVESQDQTEVCHNATGLYWERDPDSTNRGTMTHANALTFCPALNLGNGQTYRPPAVGELVSLIDYNEDDPALPNGHPFDNVQSSFYWSAVTVATDANDAWVVSLDVGRVITGLKTEPAWFAWCVRGGS